MDIATLGLAVDSRPVATANNELDRMVQVGARVEQTTKRAMGTASAAFREATGAVNAHVDAYRRREAAADSYLSSLKDEVAMYGKNRAQVEAYKASLMGLTAEQQRSAAAMGRQLDLMRAQDSQMGVMRTTAGALAGAMAAAFAAKQVYDFSRALFDASAEAQRLRTSLDFATGGSGAKELQYVTQLADKLGLQLTTTAQAYSGLAAAARGTSLEGQGARNVFESVTKASAVMGLSAENTSGVLLALQQTISKGTVQAEELRGQLGERLPGAFQIAARSMGVTTSELGKMLEQGQVLSTDFLPKFARQLEMELGGAAEKAADRLDASINRFDNAWERLKRAGGDSGVAEGFARTMTSGADSMNGIAAAMEQAAKRGEGFTGQVWAATKAMYQLGTLNDRAMVNMQDNAKATKEAEAELARLQARGEISTQNIYLRGQMVDLQNYIKDLKQARAERDLLERGTAGSGRGAVNPETVAARAQREEEARAARDAYLAADIRQTKAQRREEDIAKARKANAAMVAKAEGNSVAQAQLRKALEVEIANINEKHKDKAAPGAAAAARDEANATIAELQRAQAVTEEISRRTIANISAQRAAGTLTEIEAVKLVAAEELKRYEAAETALDKEIAIAATRKDNATQVANLEGQLALAKEKRLTREQQLQLDLADIERRRAEENRARYNADATRATQELAALIEANKQTELEIEGIGLTDRELQKLNETRMDSAIARQQEKIAAMQMLDVSGQSADAIDIETAKLKELQKARGLYSMRANMQRDAEAGQRFYASMWESIDRTAHDVFTNVADSGMSAFERIGKTLKASILDMLYRMTVQKWLIQIGASVFGSGFAGAAQTAIGSAGGIGTAINGASAIGNLFNLGTTAAGWLGSGVGAVLGGTAGNAALAASLGLGSGSAAAAASGASIAAGGTAAGAGLGASIGAAVPYIGAALLALSVLGKGFKGETRTGGQFGVAFDGSVVNERRGQTYTYQGQQFDRDFSGGMRNALTSGQAYRLEGDPVAQESAIRGAVAGTAAGINAMLAALGSGQKLAGFSAGLETSGKGRGGVFAGGKFLSGLMFGESGKGDNYAGTLYESTSTQSPDFQTALANFTLDLKQATIQALQTVDDIPATIKAALANVDAEALTEQETDALIKTISDTINGVESLRASFEAMGLDKFAKMGFDVAASLAAASGGFENLQANLGSFYQNFFSEEERRANLQASITRQLSAVGVDMPSTREQYRQITLDAIARADAAGGENKELNRIAATLIAVNSEFAQVVTSAEELAKASRTAAVTALEKAISAERDGLNRQKDLLQTQRDAARSLLSEITDIFDLLGENIRGLQGEVSGGAQMQGAQGRAFVSAALMAAKATGVLPDSTELATAIGAARGVLGDENFVTRFDADRERAMLAGELSGLQEITGKQKSIAELTLEGIDDQINLIEKQIKQNEEILKYWKEAIERADGNIAATLSVADAVNALAELLRPKTTEENKPGTPGGSFAGVGGGGGGGGAMGTPVDQDAMLKARIDQQLRFGEEKGLAFNDPGVLAAINAALYGTSATNADIARIYGIPESDVAALFSGAGIPRYDVGTNYVPRDMLAVVHEGEKIIPKKYNSDANPNAAQLSNDAQTQTLDLLRAIEANTRATAVKVHGINQTLNRVTPEGDAVSTRVVA